MSISVHFDHCNTKSEKEDDDASVYNSNAHLNDFGANLKGAGAEFLTGAVCILSVHHTDVSTASGRDHLQASHGDIRTD